MKYETKIVGIAVKSNYPIDVERVKKLFDWRLPSCTKQIIIEAPLADDKWVSGDTVGDLINQLKKLPKDMPIERYNYADISVELLFNQGIGDANLYLYSALVVSEQ